MQTDADADRTLVTDQAGKQRISKTNALGQLTDVWEIKASDSSTVAVSFPSQSLSAGYQTSYAYDTLSNLTTVSQGSQTRAFTYSSLSRLKSAANPESGTINYTYDNNGNLATKIDARSITTTYSYDALNRVTLRDYSDTTPDVTYTYDNVTNAKGKLTSISSSVSTTEYVAFDTLGRVTQSRQTTDGTVYGDTANPMTYTYNLGGALIEQKYPSGRVVKNVLEADGDLSLVQSKKNANAGYWNYAKSFTYTAAGAVSSMQLGNGRWESTVFNSRLQPTQIALGTTQNATDRLKLNFTYNTTGQNDNNGNVLTQTITVPTEVRNSTTYNGFTATQTYTYDELNRLKSATETIPSQTGWKQTFTYDRYGNRQFDTTGSNTTTLGGCATAVCNPQASASNNKFSTADGYTYDNAGNTKVDALGRTFTYDAENKQTEVKNSSNQSVGQYFYDGDGKRVKKYNPQSGETTIFVYDAAGKMVAEYSTTVASTATAQVSYLTSDHLGSPRINTDANGAVQARHDYQPFGEEIAVIGGNTARTGYSTDAVRQKFTSYERDTETPDLDFAQARTYGNQLGRFTSPDDFANDTNPTEPQSWNLYSYVRNNPLTLFDPSGQKAKVTIDKKKGTVTIEATFVVYGADGQGVTEEELNEQKELLRKQILTTYSGEYVDNEGNFYKLSTHITVETAASEKDAIGKIANAAAGNIVEVGNKEITDSDGKNRVAYATTFSRDGEKFDRVMVSILYKNTLVRRNTYAHEFAHLLGASGHTEDLQDIRSRDVITRNPFLSDSDKKRFFSEQAYFTNSPLARNANSAWIYRAKTYSKGHRKWLK